MATQPNTKPRGRKPDSSSKSGQVRALLASGMAVADIAKKVGCTTGLVYNVKARMGGAKKRGPGRPAKAPTARTPATPGAIGGLDGILAAVKNAETERTRMRAALERIQSVIADALA